MNKLMTQHQQRTTTTTARTTMIQHIPLLCFKLFIFYYCFVNYCYNFNDDNGCSLFVHAYSISSYSPKQQQRGGFVVIPNKINQEQRLPVIHHGRSPVNNHHLGKGSTLYSQHKSQEDTTIKTLKNIEKHVSKGMISIALIITLLFSNNNIMSSSSSISYAYDTTDYASETVQDVLLRLQNNYGNIDGTIKVYEDIVAIITEGKGIGGNINFKGISLNRGYVSDEDTAIYNPGLTLLTESEKQRIVSSIIQSKKINTNDNAWNIDTQAGYDYIRDKLDPYHTYELNTYFQIVPYLIIILYVGVLGVQQLLRDFFPPAYIIAVITLIVPAIALIAIGPQ